MNPLGGGGSGGGWKEGKLIPGDMCLSQLEHITTPQNGGRRLIKISLPPSSWLVYSRDGAIIKAQIWALLSVG